MLLWQHDHKQGESEISRLVLLVTCHSQTPQTVVADATAHCGNGFNGPKESPSLGTGSEVRAEITAPPGEDRRALSVSLARPSRYWLYPQTPALASSRPLPHSEGSGGPPPNKKPLSGPTSDPGPQDQGFPPFLREPEPRGHHPPPRVKEGEQSSRAAAIHYLAYGACSIE